MTSAEYLERYHKAMDIEDRRMASEEWHAIGAWADRLREAYLLMREVEERGEAKDLVKQIGGRLREKVVEGSEEKPTGPYLELTSRDREKMQADKMSPGDVYEDTNGDICIWAPNSDERSRGYTGCCWFDPEGDGATSTDQYHEEITVIGRLTAVYPNKGG